MKLSRLYLLLALLLLHCAPSAAGEKLELKQITDNVYAIVGELGNRSPQNLGNNATFGFVVTTAGVVLVDPGGTYRGAGEIADVIRQVTEQPVTRVINTGGQDHRWLGNGYFKQRGARIIASEKAVADQRQRTRDQFIGLSSLVGETGVDGTEAVYAGQSFSDSLEFDLGGTRFEIRHSGQAHTPGDSYVWLPQQKVMFTGDIVYVERMLGVGSQSNSKSWIGAFEAMAAYRPEHLVPGHGKPTNLAHARKDTLDYLVFLRKAVTEFMDDGGDISDIGSIDQSAYHYLLNHESLAGRNAQQVFSELEWE
ncbi:MAG: MBL fold metallo-hydrolase [Gammaproteobacteria bacterium]|nr:MBL fold metallo-hydrolase [Gammaproteobacteria bacterium]